MTDQKEYPLLIHLDIRPYSFIEIRGSDVVDVHAAAVKLYKKLVESGFGNVPLSGEIRDIGPVKNIAVSKSSKNTVPVTDDNPPCPICNEPTKKRSGPYGEFFGCKRYPDCKGVIRIE